MATADTIAQAGIPAPAALVIGNAIDAVNTAATGAISATSLTVTGAVQAGSASTLGISTDVLLARDAANTLALRNSTTAQTFRVYNTYTDASNYERLELTWAANLGTIQTVATGTGTNRNLRLNSAGGSTTVSVATGGTDRWTVTNAGHLTAVADNTYDIGASGATRPRAAYIAASVFASQSVAIPAGGTAGAGVMVSSTANFGVFFGSGAPTLSAAKGSLYLRSDGSSTSTRMYVNTDGSTAWTAVTTAT